MPVLDFNQRSHSGAGLQAIILNADGEKILGRGTNFTYNDNIEVNSVKEWGKRRVMEFVPGQMEGSGSLGTLFIADVKDNLPSTDDFIELGPYTILLVVAEGRPNAGTVMDQFEDVWFTVVGGQFGAAGLAAKNVNFVYGRRIKGKDIQGVSYPVQ
jgi:hypothetical protein